MQRFIAIIALGLVIAASAGVSVHAAKIELYGHDKAEVDRLNSRGIGKEPSSAAMTGIGDKKSYLHSFRGEALGLGADHSFHAFKENTDSSNVKHTRYRQMYKNIPVFGREVVIHEDQSGRIRSMNGSIEKEIERDLGAVSLTPAYSVKEALEHGKKLLSQGSLANLKRQGAPASTPAGGKTAPASGQYGFRNEQAELTIYVDEASKPRLAYYVNFYAEPIAGGEPTRPHLLLDATTREVVRQWEGLTHQAIGTGPGGNAKVGLYEYGTRYGNLDVLQSGTSCSLQNSNVTTVNMTGMSYYYSTPFNYTCPKNTVKTVNGAYSPLNDAHYFGNVIVNMYKEWYGFPPIPLPLVMRTHYGTNYENAFWDGQYITFGDGYTWLYPLVSLDVAAHEASHGFTEYNSNLVYDKESGGINESFSDMAGEAAKYFMRGSNDWRVGSDIMKTAGALRYMDNPLLDGSSIDHYAKYFDGLDVHYSSGLFNKAFYLLATKPGWNTKKAFDVMVKANRDYWVPTSTFSSAACGASAAAGDLCYNCADVENAFAGVGITPGKCCPPACPQNLHKAGM